MYKSQWILFVLQITFAHGKQENIFSFYSDYGEIYFSTEHPRRLTVYSSHKFRFKQMEKNCSVQDLHGEEYQFILKVNFKTTQSESFNSL